MDVEAISLVTSCRTLPMKDLNTSDYLPLMDSLMYEACPSRCEYISWATQD